MTVNKFTREELNSAVNAILRSMEQAREGK